MQNQNLIKKVQSQKGSNSAERENLSQNGNKDLLIQNVLDASVNFQANGNILVMPCPWEDDKQVTNGERVHYKGGIEVDADGRTRVKRYNIGMNGPQHDVLFETTHGCVKMTRPQCPPSDNGYRRLYKEFVYVTFKFPKKYGAALTRVWLEDEIEEILSYLKTMNVLIEREQSKRSFDLLSVKNVERSSKEETIWK